MEDERRPLVVCARKHLKAKKKEAVSRKPFRTSESDNPLLGLNLITRIIFLIKYSKREKNYVARVEHQAQVGNKVKKFGWVEEKKVN